MMLLQGCAGMAGMAATQCAKSTLTPSDAGPCHNICQRYDSNSDTGSAYLYTHSTVLRRLANRQEAERRYLQRKEKSWFSSDREETGFNARIASMVNVVLETN